jgi:uncharacterized MAPEG superfamily protein
MKLGKTLAATWIVFVLATAICYLFCWNVITSLFVGQLAMASFFVGVIVTDIIRAPFSKKNIGM